MLPTLVHLYLAGLTEKSQPPEIEPLMLDYYHTGAVRFVKSYNQFRPGYPHDLKVVVINSDSTAEQNRRVMSVYGDLPCELISYNGTGWDIGAYQRACQFIDSDFAVFMTTMTHFKWEGWLSRVMEEREKNGPGMYGAMASMEACPLTPGKVPNPHLRTAFFGCETAIIESEPRVMSRMACFKFESSDEKFSDVFDVVRMVTWDGSYDVRDCRVPDNVFRKGDQSNLIAYDRHTDAYDAATPEQKKFLERITNGEIICSSNTPSAGPAGISA